MAYIAKVDIFHRTWPHVASCEQCDALPGDATRARVRQHVAQTGHTVWVQVESETRYTPKPTGGDQ